MQPVKKIVKELKVFERDKVPLENTLVRGAARILSEIHPVYKTSIGWIKKFEDVDRSELILMRVYTTRNYLTMK